MTLRLFLFLSICLPLMAVAGVSESLPRGARLEHRVDLEPERTPRLELRLKLPVSALVFRREGDRFQASLRVTVKARERESGLEAAEVRSERIERASFKASRESGQFLEREYFLDLEPGRWKVEVQIFGRGSFHPWREELEITVPRPEDRAFHLQGPTWRTPPGGRLPSLAFYDPWSVPDRFVLQSDGFREIIELDCELRLWEAGDSLEALLHLRGRDQRLVHYERRLLPGTAGSRQLHWRIPVGDFSMGPYLIDVVVRQGEQEQRLRGRLEMGLGPAAFGRDWPETLHLLSYHADLAQIERLDQALPERRLPAFLEYWRERDGLPGSEENPALEAFFSELSLVGREFGSRWMAGYRSDRGRIRLEYGPPLRIDEIQDDLGLRRRQLWTYATGQVFVFESRQAGDDFVLVERWDH